MTTSLLAEYPLPVIWRKPRVNIPKILEGLELLAGRADSVYADFILAGPVNLWFKGIQGKLEPRYILVTSETSGPILKKVLCVNAEELEWSEEWSRIQGKLVRCRIYNSYTVEALVNPSFCGEKYVAAALAKNSEIISIGNYMVRLAPLYFEAALGEALLGEQSCNKIYKSQETSPVNMVANNASRRYE